ncbi:DUF3088 domain-containing protein [Microvirga antarctica]|uniref:DUF3088 domain-containing protein n=1 Tax=Microvirga antarctica TaxID=2819233 RepID=UPI001B306606|nr:DUF3088 domain-containing protein [Microvirga antarctica]
MPIPFRDRLFVLTPGFADPAFPGRRFYCWHCALLEGVLASFPHLAARLEVVRVAWPRPRADVIALVGESHQSLPLLVLGTETLPDVPAEQNGSVRFVADKDAILRALTIRHGFPEPHP